MVLMAAVLVAACGGPSPAAKRSTPPLVIVQESPPTSKDVPPTPTSGGNPASDPRAASGGRAAIVCRIPVSNSQPGSGGFVNLPAGDFSVDPASNVAVDWTGAPSPPATSQPRLGPYGPGGRAQNFGLSYDRAVGRWLPVQVSWVAPDGQSYAYPDYVAGGVRIARVSDGSVTTVGGGSFWNILDVESEGVYAVKAQFEGPVAAGLWRLTPGRDVAQVTGGGFWQWVTTGFAYGFDAPSVPQGAQHPLLKLNLRTGNIVTWYQHGENLQWIAGFDNDGSPVATLQPPPAYGYAPMIETVVIPRPDVTVLLLEAQQGAQTPVVRDGHGFWIEAGGLYLNSVGYGAEKVSDVNGQLGGTCA